MKKSYLYLLATILLAFLFFSFNSAKIKSQIEDFQPLFSGGPGTGGLGDRTGSPLSSATCAQCHSGGSFNATLGVQVLDGSTPVSSYTAGDTYTVVYTVSGSSNGFGFQGGVLTSTNAAGGTFSSPSSNAQLVTISGRPYFEHDGGPSNTGVFQASWTAPIANTGTVSFYGVGLAVNQNGGTSGDQTTSPVVFSLTEACSPTTGVDTQIACDSLQWIDGNTYFSNNTTATHTLINAANCDSIVTLNLTINTVDNSVTQSGVSLSSDVSGAAYQWLDCNSNYSIISGETNQSYVASVNGNYAVQINQNGCVDTSACNSIASVGFLENSFGNELLLYPNPTNGNFSIDLGSNFKSTTLSITDVKGKLIQSETFFESQILNVSLSEPNGIYLLIIESKNKKAKIRLIKE